MNGYKGWGLGKYDLVKTFADIGYYLDKDNNLIGMISADDFNDNNREWNNSEKLIRTVADNITNII